MKIDLPLKVTKHCQDRMKEFRVNTLNLLYWLPQAQKEKPPKKENKKYPIYDNVTHWRYGTYVMAVARVRDPKEGFEVYLLLSIFDQRMYL